METVGLVFDIFGVMTLWKFGIPNLVTPRGELFLVRGETEEGTREWKRYSFWSRVGLSLLLLGFALQALGNILSE